MTKLLTKNALIVFAKPPVAGLAKTRLIPALGAAGAAAYHAKLVKHTLVNVVCDNRSGKLYENKWDTHLWCSENKSHDFFLSCLSEFSVTLQEQSQGDLGERMFHAMHFMLKKYDKVCIIGCDCPVLDRNKITEVFARLMSKNDVVVTPAEDGGYVLMAVKQQLMSEMFSSIQWGGADVFERVLYNLRGLNLNPLIQPTLWDVDEPEDLNRQALAMLLPPA